MTQSTEAASLQAFRDRARITQIIYQTLVNGSAQNQPEELRGIPAADAELLHSLSTATAALTSANPVERELAWRSISNTANLALQFIQESALVQQQEPSPQ